MDADKRPGGGPETGHSQRPRLGWYHHLGNEVWELERVRCARRIVKPAVRSTTRSDGLRANVAGSGHVADISAILSGDQDVYTRIVNRYQNAIGTYMWRFTRDETQYKELVQDVFVEAYLSLRTYRQEAPFLHWLSADRDARGIPALEIECPEKARSQVEMDENRVSDVRAANREDTEWEREFIHAALAQLSPRDRLVLTLVHLEGLSTKEASETLGWSHALVRVQAYRARKAKSQGSRGLAAERMMR